MKTILCMHPNKMNCLYCRPELMKVPDADKLEVANHLWITAGTSYGGPCKDCSGRNEPYMVTAKVWKEAKLRRGFVCLKCIETRISRKLQLSDFILAPINFGCFLFDVRNWVK